jgi:hypothetical protein
MSTFYKAIKSSWSWVYERTIIWIMTFFFIIFAWGAVKKGELNAEINKEVIECHNACLPQSSEYFTSVVYKTSQCWCYNDEQTLVKQNKM